MISSSHSRLLFRLQLLLTQFMLLLSLASLSDGQKQGYDKDCEYEISDHKNRLCGIIIITLWILEADKKRNKDVLFDGCRMGGE